MVSLKLALIVLLLLPHSLSVECPTGCATCDDTGKICKTCNAKHFLNEAKKLCEACGAYCSNCESNDICTTCTPGFYLYNRQCVQTCPVEYGKSDNGKCEKCDVHCLRCTQSNKCDLCEEGYYLDSAFKCHQCMNNCLKCTSYNKCTECSGGFKTNETGTCEEIKNWFWQWLPWILLGLALLCCLCCLAYFLLQRQRTNYQRLDTPQNYYSRPERSYYAQPQEPTYIYKPVYVPYEVERPTLTSNVTYASPPSLPQRNLNFNVPVTDNFGRVGSLTVSEIM